MVTKLTLPSKENAVQEKVNEIIDNLGGGYSAGTGIDISNNTISVDNTVAMKTDIPAPVTETTVSGWGFTKNTGTVTSVNGVSPVNGNVTLSIPAAQVNSDWNAVSGVAQILNKPSLATVATTGAYSDLSGTPTVDQTYSSSSTNAQSGVAVAQALSSVSVSKDNLSITNNSNNQLQTVGVIDQNDTTQAIKTWTGTLAQYNALKPFPLYAWLRGEVDWYTLTAIPSVGDYLYQSDGVTTVGVITQYDTSPTERIIVNGFSHGRDASADTYSPSHINSSTLYNITDDTDFTLTLLETLYPVGSIYITTASTCPLSTLISGSTWELVSSGRVLQGADSGHSAGTTIEAGLPNVTGSSNTFVMFNISTASGALSIENVSPYGDANTGVNTERQCYKLSFDASNSDSIYGNSTTVQPPAYFVNIYRRTV